MAEERMLNDEILLGLIKANSGGGGGGTTDYDDLSNKPQIAGTTLSGNKSLADLGIASATELSGILDGANIDSFGDVETALEGKQNTITAGDDLKFSGSTLNVEVSVPFIDEYTIEKVNENDVKITKKHKGVATDTWTYQTGTYTTYNVDNVMTLQYDGPWILTLTKASTTSPVGTSWTWQYMQTPTVSSVSFEGAETGTASEFITALGISVDGLASSKQPKTDNNLTTTSKEVTGAINEVKSGLTDKQDKILQTGLFNTATGSIETGITIQKIISAYSANWANAYCYIRRKDDNTAIIDVKDSAGNTITSTNMAVVVTYLP